MTSVPIFPNLCVHSCDHYFSTTSHSTNLPAPIHAVTMSSTPPQKLTIDFILNEDSKSQLQLQKNDNKDHKHYDKKSYAPTRISISEKIPVRTSTKFQDLDQHYLGAKTGTEISARSQRQHPSSIYEEGGPSLIPAAKQHQRAFVCEICSRVFTEKGMSIIHF